MINWEEKTVTTTGADARVTLNNVLEVGYILHVRYKDITFNTKFKRVQINNFQTYSIYNLNGFYR